MTEKSGGDERPEQEAVDEAFSEIVAGLEAEWTADSGKETTREKKIQIPDNTESPEHREGWRTGNQSWEQTLFDQDPASDDEHYLPPEPPKLPRLSAVTLMLILLILFGLFLLIAPKLLGIGEDLGLTLGIAGIALGLILLLLRNRQRPSDHADPTTGAQI